MQNGIKRPGPTSVAQKLRFALNWVVPVVLGGLYGHATFVDPIRFVTEGASAVEPGSVPAELWRAMSPTARGLGPQLGGWAVCYALVVGGFLACEPTQRTHQLMSRIQAVIMLGWWPAVWYGAMAPNADYRPMDAWTYLQQMSIGETVMGVAFAYCGWFVSA
jgi:hypothetical protein